MILPYRTLDFFPRNAKQKINLALPNTTKIYIRLMLLYYGPKKEWISSDTSEIKPDKMWRFLRFR